MSLLQRALNSAGIVFGRKLQIRPYDPQAMQLPQRFWQMLDDLSDTRGVHETDFEYFAAFNAADTVFVDVGASIGTSALSISHRCPAAAIFSFEPNLLMRPFLDRVRGLNSRLAVKMVGLGEARRQMTLHMPVLGQRIIAGEASLTSEHFDLPVVRKRLHGYGPDSILSLAAVKCEIERLDDQTEAAAACEKARWRFLKIDVEGAELDVLKGGEDFIRRFRPTILIEEGHRPEITGYLAGFGYSRYLYDAGSKTLAEAGRKTSLNSFFVWRRA